MAQRYPHCAAGTDGNSFDHRHLGLRENHSPVNLAALSCICATDIFAFRCGTRKSFAQLSRLSESLMRLRLTEGLRDLIILTRYSVTIGSINMQEYAKDRDKSRLATKEINVMIATTKARVADNSITERDKPNLISEALSPLIRERKSTFVGIRRVRTTARQSPTRERPIPIDEPDNFQ